MKKTISLLIFLMTFTVFSQDKSQPDFKRNEIKLNGLSLVLGAVDLTYERVLNEESGVGVTAFITFDDAIIEDASYFISPYYRFYFGKKPAAGFFLEGFGLLGFVEAESFRVLGDVIFIEEETLTDFALGIGLGGKWVTNGGFIGEIGLGVGRNFFNNDRIEEIVGKVLVTIGYRF